MNRSATGVSLALVAVLSLGACSQQPSDNGPDYADDEAMELIADGLENRSDVIDQQIENGESTGTNKAYEEAVNAELEIIEPLRNRQFESSQLQEDVLSYINVLNESLDVIGNYPTSDMNFLTKWTEVYDERTSMLKEFVDNYDLKLDSEHQSVLDELVANGAAAIQRSAIDEKRSQLWKTPSSSKRLTRVMATLSTPQRPRTPPTSTLEMLALSSASTTRKGLRPEKPMCLPTRGLQERRLGLRPHPISMLPR